MSQRRLPAEVYWRRRLVLLAGVIALVWVALQLTGSGEAQPSADPTPTPSAPAPTTPSVKVDGIVDVSLTSATKACDPEQIRITPTVRPDQLTKGPIDIGLVVSSRAEGACTLMPKDADVLAVISANDTAIWDSTVCRASLLTAPVAVSPQWASLVTAQWSGRGSGANCSSDQGYAPAGKYLVQIGTLGGEPGKTTFTLEPRPKPKPKATEDTATPKPPKTTTKPADD